MIKRLIFLLLVSLQAPLVAITYQPTKAEVIGSSVGEGISQGEAYSKAMSNLPFGARVYQRVVHRSPNQYMVILYWRK